jgi:hypothetical protein
VSSHDTCRRCIPTSQHCYKILNFLQNVVWVQGSVRIKVKPQCGNLVAVSA